MASMTGLSEQELQRLLGVTETRQDPATLGLMPMPSYSPEEYGGLFSASGPVMRSAGPVQGSKVDRGSGWNEFHSSSDAPPDQVAYRSPPAMRLPTEPSLGPKGMPPVDTQLAIVRELNPNTLGYSEPLPPSAAVAAGKVAARRTWADSWRARQGGSPMIAGTPRLVPGDPWSGLRIGGVSGPQRPGLATGTLMRAGTPSPAAPVMVAAQPGYNGTNNVTSSELRPVHQSIFSDNAMLPSAMNTKRWIGDGY
jgi:hypothetical protein